MGNRKSVLKLLTYTIINSTKKLKSLETFLTVFYICHESGVKIVFKWFINRTPLLKVIVIPIGLYTNIKKKKKSIIKNIKISCMEVSNLPGVSLHNRQKCKFLPCTWNYNIKR